MGFVDQAGASAGRGAPIGAGVGFVVGCLYFARQPLTLKLIGEIAGIAGFFGAAGAAFGVVFEAVALLP